MDRFIARKNIEHLSRQLAEARDPEQRENLARLLSEAEEQLRRSEAAHAEKPHAEPHLRPGAGVDGLVADDRMGEAGRIAEIVERLQLEADQMQRRSLRQSLLEEEDKYGTLAERMDIADAYIEDGALRVAALSLLVAGLSHDDVTKRRQVANLAASLEVLETFKSYRASLEDWAGRNDL